MVTGVSESFGYDGYDRLTSWTYNSPQSGLVKFQYDELWNLRTRTNGAQVEYFSPQPGLGGPHMVQKSNFGNCLYDKKGNQVHAPGRDLTYTCFDLPAKLTTQADVWNYLYDGEGNRIVKTDANGTEIISIARAYERRTTAAGYEHHFKIVLPGAAEAEMVIQETKKGISASTTYYLHKDHLGSLKVVSSGSKIVDRLAYDPFGRRTDPKIPGNPGKPPSSGTFKGYADHEHDLESGLINMLGRLYDPVSGRFLTPDPLINDILRPRSLNPYAYVYNNPQTLRDPVGLEDDSNGGDDDDDEKKDDDDDDSDVDSCGHPYSDTPTGDTPPVPGVNTYGNTDNGIDGCMDPDAASNTPAPPMTFAPMVITLTNYEPVDIYRSDSPAITIITLSSADVSQQTAPAQPSPNDTPLISANTLGTVANVSTIAGGIGTPGILSHFVKWAGAGQGHSKRCPLE